MMSASALGVSSAPNARILGLSSAGGPGSQARVGSLGSVQRFSLELWSGIEDTYRAICEHPFITGLTDGSLEHSAFEFYVIQDAHYLREYARALSVAAARAPAEADIAMFNEHAAGAIAVERSLHESFFAELGLSEQHVARTPIAPPTSPTRVTCRRPPTAARSPSCSVRCCPATGSTRRWVRRCWPTAHPTRSTPAGSRPTAVRSSPRSFARCSSSPTASGPSSARASARVRLSTSRLRAGTSGCSGRWATGGNSGPCRTRQAARRNGPREIRLAGLSAEMFLDRYRDVRYLELAASHGEHEGPRPHRRRTRGRDH